MDREELLALREYDNENYSMSVIAIEDDYEKGICKGRVYKVVCIYKMEIETGTRFYFELYIDEKETVGMICPGEVKLYSIIIK